MKKRVKIGIADSHKFVHDGVQLISEYIDDKFEVVLNAISLDELETKLSRKAKLDILIMDVSFPVGSGIEVCRKISTEHPKLKILIFSEFEDISLIAHLFETGAHCYLQKTEGFEALCRAIHEVHSTGYCYLYDMGEVLRSKKRNYSAKHKRSVAIPYLSDREKAIIQLVRKELTTKQIAQSLNLHVKTIEMHRRNIIEKSNSKGMVGAIDFLVSHRVIPARDN